MVIWVNYFVIRAKLSSIKFIDEGNAGDKKYVFSIELKLIMEYWNIVVRQALS